MTDFLKDMENIKTFHKFLGIVINQVEKGNKVDFKSITHLSKMINTYFEEFDSTQTNEQKESIPTESIQSESIQTESKQQETVKITPPSIPKIEDKFLNDIMSNVYQSKKIRKINTEPYINFKNNILFY